MIASDDPELRRLSVRSWRRGTKEMDLLLGPYFDRHGAEMAPEERAHFAQMMEENDQDLYAWISGRAEAPAEYAELISAILRDRLDHNISANRN